MDSKMQTDMIVLDFAKAFDKVSHPRLLRLQYLLVVLVVNRTVDGTVICKKTDGRLHVFCDVMPR
jgi:hypothetical protein